MNFRGWRSLLLVAALAVGFLLLFSSVDVDAQCSMCRASLTNSQNARLIRGMNMGVLVLLIPPVSIFCSIFFLLRRYRGNG
jgi:hypothetical protein